MSDIEQLSTPIHRDEIVKVYVRGYTSYHKLWI